MSFWSGISRQFIYAAKTKARSRHHVGPTRERIVCNASISPMIPPRTRAWKSLINWRNILAKSYYQYPFVGGLLCAARAESVSKASGIIDKDRQGSTFPPRRGPFSEWRSLKVDFCAIPSMNGGWGTPAKSFRMLKVRISLQDKKVDTQP